MRFMRISSPANYSSFWIPCGLFKVSTVLCGGGVGGYCEESLRLLKFYENWPFTRATLILNSMKEVF